MDAIIAEIREGLNEERNRKEEEEEKKIMDRLSQRKDSYVMIDEFNIKEV
jgi:hypothetical protein